MMITVGTVNGVKALLFSALINYIWNGVMLLIYTSISVRNVAHGTKMETYNADKINELWGKKDGRWHLTGRIN